MKTRKFFNRLAILSAGFFVVGVILLIVENIFYQYVDENGVLHESMFLPLGTLFLIVGVVGVLVWVGVKVFTPLFSSSK